jgi:perosamine synthetase
VGNIPVFEPSLFGNEWEFVKQALDENQLSGTSPVVREFETRFAEFVGVKYCVAAANGTAALHLAMLALDLQPGDEVLIPDFTIISNALAVTLCGATPVFVDVSSKDWCINVQKIREAITPRTKGIIPVHMFGVSCDMDVLREIAREKNLWVVEDAAQAQSATWNGARLGSLGDMGTFSFYANKLITTGEGGAVTTNDETLYKKLKVAVNLGFDPEPTKRFIHQKLTHNYRLSSLQAALGISQLTHARELIQNRERTKSFYRDAFGEPKGYWLPQPDPKCEPSFWMCAVCLDPAVNVTIPRLQQKLTEKGIETRRFFYPLHRQPALSKYHQQREAAFPVTERLFDRGIYLPSSANLSFETVSMIVDNFHGALR